MNISTSIKLRAFGGASVLALTAGLGTASIALAQVVIDETVEDRQVVPGGGSLEVTVDGAIDVADDEAVQIDGDDAEITNDGTISAGDGRAIDGRGVDDTTILNSGLITSTSDDTIDVSGSTGVTITNSGSIIAEANDTKAIDGGENLTVINSGIIRSMNGDGKGVEGDANLTIMNMEGGLIESLGTGAEAVEADAPGLTLVNNGTIRSEFDDGVDGDADVTITNTGLISGNNNDGIELNSGTITNSGTIISLGSDPDGTLVTPGGLPELDAAIDFDTGELGEEDGAVFNLAGGLIEGDIGIEASPGNVDNPTPNRGSQVIVNQGTITGREGDAVRLGEGFDQFAKIDGGVENGRVDGGNGFDLLAVGITDATNRSFDLSLIGTQYLNFEQFVFGSLNLNVLDATPTAGSGTLTLTGAADIGATILNTAILDGELTGPVTLATQQGTENPITLAFTVTENGSVEVATGDAIEVGADGFTINNAGTIRAEDGRAIEAGDVDMVTITNSGTIEASDRAINGGDDFTITNQMGGLINTTGDADTIQTGDNLTIVNDGTISNEGFDTKIIDAGDGLTVTNNGTITSDWKGIEGEDDFTLTNNEGGLIFSTNDEAVEADGPGLTVVNNGEIIAPRDDAIDGGEDVTITNTGLIRGGENDGLELDSGTITNSGIIESLSSDPEGAFSDADFTNRELDAGIDFDGVDDPDNLAGPATDTVTNLAGGIIRGDIGINASSGNFGEPDLGDDPSPANVRSQTIINFGTITGNIVNPATGRTDAVLLSGGDDVFQQWQTGVTNGTVDGESGDDTLIFGNDAEGTSTRSLTDISDPDQYTGFETYALLDTGGALALTGESAIEFSILGGDIVLEGTLTGTISADGEGSLTVAETGLIEVVGDDAVEVDVDGFTINNDGTIRSFGERAIDGRGVDGTTINNTGLIVSAGENEAPVDGGEMGEGMVLTEVDMEMIDIGSGSDAIDVSGSDGVTITNSGSIIARANDTKAIDGGENLTVINSGVIRSMNGDGKGIEGNAGLTIMNMEGGLIEALGMGAEAVEDDDGGLTLVNSGTIRSDFDDGVDGNNDANITNNATGLIQGNDNDGLELDSGTVTNFGIIESLGSDPDGDFSDIGLTNRELDAGIDFDGGGNDADSTVMNMAGARISGDIGINASSGNFVDDGEGGGVASSPANFGNQTVVNFGTITANAVNPVTGRMDAVLLSFGEDEFQQWTGATVNGWIDLEAGDDLFILEGSSSSVTGGISGGSGNDTAILAGVLDSDNFSNFETIQLGSTLGGTLNDLTITGNRTIDGDVVHVGIVNMGLGVDTLTTSGSITLTETGVLNLSTPLDEELLGQSVLVFQDGDGFVNEGATINFLDNDLLLQYTPVVGSLRVLVGSVDPLVNNPDPNLVIAGNAVNQALNAGTLGGATFDALNTLPDASAYADAIGDALPSLSDGVGREIFETGSLAGQALDRHLAGTKSGLWGQIAVRGAEQDARSQTIEGYQSDQLVFTLGGDFALGDNLRIGLMGSYADIEVDDVTDTGALTGTQEVDSIRVGAYAAAKVLGRGFFNAEVAYLTGEVDAVRDGFFGMISSDYDFDGYAARATLGYDLLADENVSFTPTVGINAARIKFDDTVEIGGFGFGIERDDAEFLEGRLGALLGAQMSEKVSGFIQGIVIHDFADDVESVALTSSQLPGIRIAPLAREQDRFELSAGLSVDVSENFAIELGYLGDFNDGYDAHSGRASLRIAF